MMKNERMHRMRSIDPCSDRKVQEIEVVDSNEEEVYPHIHGWMPRKG